MKQMSVTRARACQSRGCPLGEETELVPGGCDVEVTFENRLQYIEKVVWMSLVTTAISIKRLGAIVAGAGPLQTRV